LDQDFALPLNHSLLDLDGISALIWVDQVGAGPIPAFSLGRVITVNEMLNSYFQSTHPL
jgi:hypothetical protein